MARPAMRFELIDKVLLLIHSDEEPSAAEWDAFLALYDAHIAELRGLIVYSQGPGPDSDRRKRIADINAKRIAPIGVVTSSRVTRGIVTALSWFGLKIKAFEPEQLPAAFDYLHLQGLTRSNVQKAYDALFRSVFGASSNATSKA